MGQLSRAQEVQSPDGELDIERPLVFEPDKQIKEVRISLLNPQCTVKIGTKLEAH